MDPNPLATNSTATNTTGQAESIPTAVIILLVLVGIAFVLSLLLGCVPSAIIIQRSLRRNCCLSPEEELLREAGLTLPMRHPSVVDLIMWAVGRATPYHGRGVILNERTVLTAAHCVALDQLEEGLVVREVKVYTAEVRSTLFT